MARLPMGEGNPLPEKKHGSARKKAKRKNLVRLDWSGEQESVGSSSAQHPGSSNRTSSIIAGDKEAVTSTASDNSAGVQEQVQNIEPENRASPKPTEEAKAMAPTPSDSSKGVQEQVRKVEYGDRTSPGFSRKAEAKIPPASVIDPEILKLAKIPPASVIDRETQKLAKIPPASVIDPEIQKLATTLQASNIDSPIQKQAQAAEATPEISGEAETTIPTGPELSLVTPKSTNYQPAESSLDDFAPAAGSSSSPDVQQNDALPHDSHSPTTSGPTGEHRVLQQDQEGQNADNLSSENMRPNAQNLRYGGYPAQPAPQHRNTPLGSGRLQNTSKIGGFEILHVVSYNRNADASELVR